MKNYIIVIALSMLAIAQAVAEWKVYKHADDIQGDKLIAVSPVVKFEKGNQSQIRYVCQHLFFSGFYSWIEIQFEQIPPMKGEGKNSWKMLYFDALFTPSNTNLNDMRFFQEYDEGLFSDEYELEMEDRILELMVINDEALIRYPAKKAILIHYPLKGSMDAINQVREFCGESRIER